MDRCTSSVYDRTVSSMKTTENERQILLQLFAGYQIDEIAAAAGSSTSAIADTLRGLREQLGARTDYDLLRECARRRIVELDEIFALADERRSQNPSADAPTPPKRRRSS
jgi:DNA-binding CsgD family transcriptional regulator